MKEFKQYINELRTKPADSNAKHDSDHDLVDVSDETVVRRLNAFLGVISEKDHMLPEHPIDIVRRRLANIGIQFDEVNIDGDTGNVSAPLSQFGGRFGKDIDTPHDEFLNDDGISHKVEGGRSINFSYAKQDNGKFKVSAQIK